MTDRQNEQKEIAAQALKQYTEYAEERAFQEKRDNDQLTLEIEDSQ